MSIEALIAEGRALEEVASKIQVDKRVGATEAEIEDLTERYYEWYTDCLAILPEDLEEKFRFEHKGKWHSPKIKAFLEAPTEPNRLYQNDESGIELIPYWQNPYKDNFRAPLLSQRRVLQEMTKRKGTEDRSADAVSKLELIARRFHLVARQLLRRRNNRPTIEISDEYDVQDLFRGLLKLYFDDVRPEETTPSYAGGSFRIDYLLKNEQVVVEVKKTRPQLRAKEVRDELIIDMSAYRSHPNCKTLVAFVYDPDMYIDNPSALENDLSRVTDGMDVKVIVSQR